LFLASKSHITTDGEIQHVWPKRGVKIIKSQSTKKVKERESKKQLRPVGPAMAAAVTRTWPCVDIA